MTVLNDRIEVENRLLHRVIETISSSLDLDVILRETIALVREATRGRGRLPPSVEPRARAPHVARPPTASRTPWDASRFAWGRASRLWRSTGRSSSSRRTSSPTSLQVHPRAARQGIHLVALGAARVAVRQARGRAFNVHGRERRDFSRATSSSCAARPRSSPPRSSMRTSFERSRRRRRPSRTSFGGRSRPRRRNADASRPRSTTASPSSWSPRGTDLWRCAGRCPDLSRAAGAWRRRRWWTALEEARWAIQMR